MTAEEFFDWVHRPENSDRLWELERGEVVEMSRPGKLHGLICANAVGILGNFAARRQKGYVCSNNTGVVVGRGPDTVRGPDVLFFEDAEYADQIEEAYGESPPLLAVEVLCLADIGVKLAKRVLQLLTRGVAMVWVIDLDERSVTVYQLAESPRILGSADELDCNNILPGFRCRVAEFFALPGKQS